jgi:hypothetical protein
MAKVEMYRTDAPVGNPHPRKKGVAVDAPYNPDFQARIKSLPSWAWEWRSQDEVWVVDLAVWPWVKKVVKEEFS